MTGNSNTAARRLAALALVLALALAQAAPSDALVIPDGIATSAANFERTSPAAVAASPGGPRRSVAAPSSESGGNPILWFTDYFVPVVPEVGGKRAFTLSVVNLGGKTIAKGAVVIIWANRTVPVVCGVSGADADAEYKLPEIPPFKTVTLKVKVPYTSDPIKANSTATMRIFVDATCVVYKDSDKSNQWDSTNQVVEKGTDYAYLVVKELGPDYFPYGLEYSPVFDTTPKIVPSGALFSTSFAVQNVGTAPLPDGVKVQVWSAFPDAAFQFCNTTGGVKVDVPKIGPGKSKIITAEGLKAIEMMETFEGTYITVLTDTECKIAPSPTELAVAAIDLMPSPSAYFNGIQVKGQATYTVKTAPKAPNANTTMAVKIKFLNWGPADGAIGKVGVWLTPAGDWPAPLYGGTVIGENCAYTGFAATADFSDVVVKAGKSKTVKMNDVPVPLTAGWWQVSALADINCTLPASSRVGAWSVYTAFEVKAP